MIKKFSQFVNEASKPYAGLADYLVNYPDLKAKIKPGAAATVSVIGSYLDMFGTARVDLRAVNLQGGAIVATGSGEGQLASAYSTALKALGSALKTKAPAALISTTAFPLLPGTVVTGTKSNLTESA